MYGQNSTGSEKTRNKITIMKNCINGLRVLHSLNVVHRDIKPDNILVELDEKRIRVLNTRFIDYGVSCIKGDNKECLDDFSGTPSYMDPNIVTSSPDMSYNDKWIMIKASDIWSLGLTFFDLIFEIHFATLYKDLFRVNVNSDNIETELPKITQANINKIINIESKKKEIYKSEKIREMLTRMLKIDYTDRPTIDQLYNFFIRNFENQSPIHINIPSNSEPAYNPASPKLIYDPINRKHIYAPEESVYVPSSPEIIPKSDNKGIPIRRRSSSPKHVDNPMRYRTRSRTPDLEKPRHVDVTMRDRRRLSSLEQPDYNDVTMRNKNSLPLKRQTPLLRKRSKSK